jgi:hypothetical protein
MGSPKKIAELAENGPRAALFAPLGHPVNGDIKKA